MPERLRRKNISSVEKKDIDSSDRDVNDYNKARSTSCEGEDV